MRKKLYIIHFKPIEGYPPIQNLLAFLAQKNDLKVVCFSTKGDFAYKWEAENIVVYRFGWIGSRIGVYRRLSTYLFFNLAVLFKLIVLTPRKILYIETLSSWPAIFYRKNFNRQVKLFVHYHEYTTPIEYTQGMKLVQYFHSLEKKWYNRAYWISHTNKFRLDKFKEDEGIEKQKERLLHILPNYPPSEWADHRTKKIKKGTVRLVYIGYSISFNTMYAKELCDWVLKNEGVELHYYLHKLSVDLESYIVQEGLERIQMHKSIPYNDIPKILSQYDIGLMLYKGTTDNYKYNATNKLFEYLACGLDVWFPKQMLGAHEYVCEDTEPRVLALDFEKLGQYSISYLFGRVDLPRRETDFFCEPVYEKLYQAMLGE